MVSAMLTTIPDETARKVADDIRAHGHGYLRVDRTGRVEHVPAFDQHTCTPRCSPCLYSERS